MKKQVLFLVKSYLAGLFACRKVRFPNAGSLINMDFSLCKKFVGLHNKEKQEFAHLKEKFCFLN